MLLVAAPANDTSVAILALVQRRDGAGVETGCKQYSNYYYAMEVRKGTGTSLL